MSMLLQLLHDLFLLHLVLVKVVVIIIPFANNGGGELDAGLAFVVAHGTLSAEGGAAHHRCVVRRLAGNDEPLLFLHCDVRSMISQYGKGYSNGGGTTIVGAIAMML